MKHHIFRGENSSGTQSLIKTVASNSPSISIGQAVISDGYYVSLANSTNLAGVLTHAGIATSSAAAGNEIYVIHHGLVDPTIFNLGDGYVCAVGSDANGNVVRITDNSCASGLKYIGHCDGYGTITIAPRLANNLNVKDFGARGDGVTDDTNAILAMVASAKNNSAIANIFAGIRLYFPQGIYLCSSQINFDTTADDTMHNWPNTTICGDGSGVIGNGNRGCSTLIYTGTGSTSFISARSTTQFTMRDISVIYQSGSFTGTLIDCGGYATADFETINATFINVNMGCDAAAHSSAFAMLSLDACLNSIVEDCHIAGAQGGIYITAYASLGGNNSTLIRTTAFGPTITGAGIYNPGFNTTIMNCSFEDTAYAIAVNSTSNAQIISGLSFIGNWMGDADAYYANAWVDPGNWLMCGCDFSGNTFGQVSRGPSDPQHDSIKLGSCQGVNIHGNTLVTVDFSLVVGGSYPQAVVISGNQLNGGNTVGAPYWRNLRAYSGGVMIFGNYPSGFNDTGALDQLGFGGHIITTPIMLTQPGIAATTNASAALDGNTTSGSNDTGGRITLTVTGGGTSAGVQCTLTFANAFDSVGAVPKVFLQAENASTSAIIANIYVTPSISNFEIVSTSGLAAGTYVLSYFVIG